MSGDDIRISIAINGRNMAFESENRKEFAEASAAGRLED
jgi:hypothetical protein